MSQFPGFIWLESEPDQPVPAEATVDEGRLVIVSGEVEIVDWAVRDTTVATIPNGFMLRSSDGELLFSTNRTGFAQALAAQRSP